MIHITMCASWLLKGSPVFPRPSARWPRSRTAGAAVDAAFPPTTNVEMFGMSIEANYLAPYGILAPGLTRSRFSDLRVQGANSVGLSCNYGWCDLGPARTVLAPHQ